MDTAKIFSLIRDTSRTFRVFDADPTPTLNEFSSQGAKRTDVAGRHRDVVGRPVPTHTGREPFALDEDTAIDISPMRKNRVGQSGDL